MKKIHLSLVFPLLLLLFTAAFADGSLWTHKPSQEIKWYQVLDVGTVLVGTANSVYSLDPDNGATLWTRGDLQGIEEYEAHQIKGTPLLLISDPKGYVNAKSRVLAVDLLSGKTLWETDKIKGHSVEVATNYQKDMIVLLTVANKQTQKDKLDIYALRISNGALLWQAEYADKVELYGKEKGSKFFPTFDLTGANPPLFDGDSVYFTYAGVHRYSLIDGKLVWKTAYDVTEGRIKRGNAQAVLDGDTIYTSAKGQLRAIDKATGAIKWASKDFGGAIAEMIVDKGTIYGRLGGHFYDFGKREYVKKSPLGVVAVDKTTGAAAWFYEGAKNNITNMALIREANTLLIADEKNLIGLDLSSTGKVKEAYKTKLEFKYKVGAAAAATKAAKIGFGALSGGVFGAAKGGLSKGADSTDDPVLLTRRKDGLVIVRGMQHILAFDPMTKSIPWSTQFEAPGAAGWQKIVMGALTAASAYLNLAGSVQAQVSAGYKDSQSNRFENNMIGAFNAYEQFLTKRYSVQKTVGDFTYVMTNLSEGKEKGAGIVGVNMSSGQGERQILFNDKDPDFEVDEEMGRVYNLRNGKELAAFAIR